MARRKAVSEFAAEMAEAQTAYLARMRARVPDGLVLAIVEEKAADGSIIRVERRLPPSQLRCGGGYHFCRGHLPSRWCSELP